MHLQGVITGRYSSDLPQVGNIPKANVDLQFATKLPGSVIIATDQQGNSIKIITKENDNG